MTSATSTQQASSERINYLDIAKGIGIILVVWAHASGPFSSFIYQMHMPFFFLISGLLYNSRKSLKEFIVGKIKSLYIPFAFWNILFYTISSAINQVGVLTIVKNDIEIVLTLDKDGTYFGATWFLGALFAVSIVYKIADTIIQDSKYKEAFLLIFFATLALLGFQHTFKFKLSRTFILSLFFAAGAFIKKHKEDFKNLNCLGMALMGSALFILIGSYNSASMGSNEYTFPLLFVIGAFLASFALLYYCKVMDSIQFKFWIPIKNTLSFLGRRSLDIVIWQFNAFRVVIIIQMLIRNEAISWEGVLSHYPCYITTNGWWLVYTISGIVISLVFCNILRLGPWGKLFKKIHIV